MEVQQLRYFIAVAEELHFGRAAKKLQISQPPLSRQIKKLETELDFQLFSRTKHHVNLTPAGEFFLIKTYEFMDLMNHTREETRRINLGESGELIIAFTGAISFKILPTIVSLFQEEYPRVNIVLRGLSTTEQMNAFEEKVIHIGLLNMPFTFNNDFIHMEQLHKEPLVAVLPKTHPLAHKNKPVDLYDLKNEGFLMTAGDSGGFHNTTVTLCQSHGFTPMISQEVSELPTAVSLVAAGMGVAILPASMQFIVNDAIRYLPLAHDDMHYKTGIAWSKKNIPPVVTTFISFIRNHITPEKMLPYY